MEGTEREEHGMTLLKRGAPEAADTFVGRRLFDLPDLFKVLVDDDADALMRVEEFRDNGTLVIKAEMPGLDPEKDVDVSVSDHRLHIRAERREETKSEDKQSYRSEFRYGLYARTMELPPGATEDDVKATYKDGILEIRIPMAAEEAEAKKVPVTRS
jgi:HSP20 family protein